MNKTFYDIIHLEREGFYMIEIVGLFFIAAFVVFLPTIILSVRRAKFDIVTISFLISLACFLMVVGPWPWVGSFPSFSWRFIGGVGLQDYLFLLNLFMAFWYKHNDLFKNKK